MSVCHLNADDIFNIGIDIEQAVDMADRVVRSLYGFKKLTTAKKLARKYFRKKYKGC